MTTITVKGRFISCFRQADEMYHLAVLESYGVGRVIELYQHEIVLVLGNFTPGDTISFTASDKYMEP